MPVWVAILIAVGATSLMNFGLALQKRGASSLPTIGKEKGGKVFKAFLTSRTWLLGTALMTFGWGFYLVSAKFAPISIIQLLPEEEGKKKSKKKGKAKSSGKPKVKKEAKKPKEVKKDNEGSDAEKDGSNESKKEEK